MYNPISPSTAFQLEHYSSVHTESILDRNSFWKCKANLIHWFAPFTSVSQGDFLNGDINWFANGKTNVCYNCVDRHLADSANKVCWKLYIDNNGLLCFYFIDCNYMGKG